MDNENNILVIGGEGYVGNVVIKKLLDEKYNILSLDLLANAMSC